MNCAEYEDYLKLLEENKRLQQALTMSQQYAQELLGDEPLSKLLWHWEGE